MTDMEMCLTYPNTTDGRKLFDFLKQKIPNLRSMGIGYEPHELPRLVTPNDELYEGYDDIYAYAETLKPPPGPPGPAAP